MSGSDSGSGMNPSYSSYSKTFSSGVITTSSISYTIRDRAGNSKYCSKTANVYVDKVAPTCGTASGSSSFWRRGPVTVRQYCNDSGSGCRLSYYSKTYYNDKAGYTFIYDKAGNQKYCSYNVYADSTSSYTPYISAHPYVKYVNGNGWAQVTGWSCSYNNTKTRGSNNCIIYVDAGCNSGSCYIEIEWNERYYEEYTLSPSNWVDTRSNGIGSIYTRYQAGNTSSSLYTNTHWNWY